MHTNYQSLNAGMCEAGSSGSGLSACVQQPRSSSPLPACMRSARGCYPSHHVGTLASLMIGNREGSSEEISCGMCAILKSPCPTP